MFRNIFSQIEGAADLPMAVLVFFFLFFIGVLLMVKALRKETIEHMESLPLQDDQMDYLPKLNKASANSSNEDKLNHTFNN